jgi:hypothetical protein
MPSWRGPRGAPPLSDRNRSLPRGSQRSAIHVIPLAGSRYPEAATRGSPTAAPRAVAWASAARAALNSPRTAWCSPRTQYAVPVHQGCAARSKSATARCPCSRPSRGWPDVAACCDRTWLDPAPRRVVPRSAAPPRAPAPDGLTPVAGPRGTGAGAACCRAETAAERPRGRRRSGGCRSPAWPRSLPSSPREGSCGAPATERGDDLKTASGLAPSLVPAADPSRSQRIRPV